ncbi:CLUMA_CG003837, isoform A [Clunio marinus]|uniref:CLUMA_CG003837, isoform A n=1 Tax=Clunio marinus TaxID=568069 RepID=A0A1J1HPZ1_9DIPT|nr:CLUMA_CG003837, isoform A [Clunio marinus]
MNLKHLLVIISFLGLNLSKAEGDFDDFCTLSGTIKGLNDYSSIFIKLFNKQGNLKEKTEVSESGFFVLPIYDKGEYTIKVSAPAGYSFEPNEISFNFDGVDDICSQNKDVHFNFKGFGITGKVNIFNDPTYGAEGVTVTLFNEKNEIISKTTTDDSGIYTFSPIVPGTYKVVASHDSWHFSKSEQSVVVSTGNTKLPDDALIVSGFNLIGRVTQPSIKMGFLVYIAKGQKNFGKCNEKLPSGDLKQEISSEFDSQPICFTSAVNNGEFVFHNLANGRYLIVPHVDKNDIELHLSPSSIKAEIKRDNYETKESFEISGFTASGHVFLSQQERKGIKAASVKLNGKQIATTDAKGFYTLKNIKEGTYTIQVSAEDLQFQDHTVKISMSNPNVPDIHVSGFKVCGKVMSEQSFMVAIRKIGSTFFVRTKSDPKDGGSFCEFLGNGKYSLEVLIDEDDKNVQFYPIQQTIEVNSATISDIIFSQLRAKVVGAVSCLAVNDFRCNEVEVTLSSLDENGYETSLLKAKSVKGEYTFDEILPGRYQVTVPSDELCWETHQQNIVVKSTLENVPRFKHVGFKIGPIIASHDCKGSYKLRTESKDEKVVEKKDFPLTSGANVFCVSTPGIYDLKVSGCHVFEEDTKVLTTKESSPVYINALKHRNGIRILSEMNQQFTIEAEFEDGTKKLLKPVEQKERVDGYVAYIVNIDLKSGEKVKLIPKSEQMLFKPDQTEWKGATDCVDVAFNFIATKGLVISGKTDPSIVDVVVSLSFPKNPEHSPMTTTTNAAGEFRFPTIDPTIDYELKAEKESYIFSEYDNSRNLFHGHKLCEIIAIVKDEDGKELSNVVISISGGENYRKNLATASNGEIKFHSLRPGKYYLRAMMKEYEFKPNSQTLEIKDGETVNINLVGKRVAYSVFGKIRNLGGDPFANVQVEAVSITEACGNHQEETVSEFNGLYRIRGLQSGCEYKITLQKNANVERAIPSERNITVQAADTENVNFIAMIPITICDVSVKIRSKNNEHYKTLKLQMFKRESPDTPVFSQRLETLMVPKVKHHSNIMVFIPRIQSVDFQKVFIIEITTTLNEKNYNFKLPSFQFTANKTSYYFEVDFNPILKQPETELNKNSLVALLLIFLVGFVFLKHELVFDTVSNLWMKFNSDVASRQPIKKTEGKGDNFIDEREINQLAQYIEERKKKKSKKNN